MLLPHDLDKIKRSPRPRVVIFIELENIFVILKDWLIRIFLKVMTITGMKTAGLKPFKSSKNVEHSFRYEINEFKTSEHCGTHLDAPGHFSRGSWAVSEIPVERLFAPGRTSQLSKPMTAL